VITIGSYLHRQELADIIRRWMYGDADAGDGALIVRLVHFNQMIVSRYLHLFAERLFAELHGLPMRLEPVTLKGELKDAIVRNPPYLNQRIRELIGDYAEQPGRFYRETPCQGMMFFRAAEKGEVYLGSWRIKRIRRLAEKGARRIIDRIYDTIKGNAELMADERAERLGIPRESLITSPEEMLGEFLKAEKRFLEDLRQKREIPGTGELIINDVAGVKVVVADNEEERVRTVLKTIDMDCEVVEEERHQGRYNAVNWVVRIRPDKDDLLRSPLPEKVLAVMAQRGVNPEQAHRDYTTFVHEGEAEVYLEIIIANYQEMLESEIGRCMHEDRISEQRLRQQYRGHLAKNVEYLMRYLFLFPLSSQPVPAEVPIRLWDRYLPDYFDGVIARLFQIPQGDF